ncbi:hypothetical protein [Micromonospora sp. CA-248212]|uniref:hypothetical protein n=1 Tax=Micromonospora sp. CA-248212 TaxID=3239961 RepID=UPI003D8A1943
MTVINPVAVEDAIREVSGRIANGVMVCDTRYRAFLAADRAYDAAFARAYMAYTGAAHERRYAAELETAAEREARDVADAAYRYADRQAKALENELRALQSVGASMRAMYATAGVGER